MHALKNRLEHFTGTKAFYVFVFMTSMLIMFQRRPHVLMYANFWAEDGAVFYSQLYNNGLKSFLYPYAGYFHFVPRLVMLLTLPFGIINAPFISNITALILRTLPMMFLFTRRFGFLGLASRFFLWLYALLAPNIFEVVGNITNAQWNLALYLLMVIIAEPPAGYLEKLHDWIVLLLAGLSGPFIIFLAPVFLINIPRKNLMFRITALLMAAVQLCGVIFTAPEFADISREGADIFSWEFILWAVRVFDSRIVWGTFLPVPAVFAWLNNKSVIMSVTVFLVFSVPIVYFFFAGSWRFRICAFFGGLVLLSSLVRTWQDPQSSYELTYHWCDRYFVISYMLFFAFMIFLVMKFLEHRHEIFRLKVYACMLSGFMVMSLLSFSLAAALRDFDYKDNIRRLYYPAPAGSTVEIPINPKGWSMTLIKKQD